MCWNVTKPANGWRLVSRARPGDLCRGYRAWPGCVGRAITSKLIVKSCNNNRYECRSIIMVYYLRSTSDRSGVAQADCFLQKDFPVCSIGLMTTRPV